MPTFQISKLEIKEVKRINTFLSFIILFIIGTIMVRVQIFSIPAGLSNAALLENELSKILPITPRGSTPFLLRLLFLLKRRASR